MSSDFIRTLLTMSITGSGAALVLFALKPLLKNRVSKTAQYYMWIVPLILLLALFRITIPAEWTTSEVVSIPSIRDVVDERVVTTTELISRLYNEGAAPSQETVQYAKQNSPYHIWILAAEVIWPVGAAFFLLWTLIAYVRLWAHLRKGLKHFDCDVPRRVKVFTHHAFPTPVLMGIFRPSIILPQREYQPIELQNILAHELTHYRRHDVALKWLAVVVNALHWFNPIVYLMRREFNRACDAYVKHRLIKHEISSEHQTITPLAQKQRRYCLAV